MDSTRPGLDVATPASLIELRRSLHRVPELRFELPLTTAIVEEQLRATGWHMRTGIATSGIVVSAAADVPGPHIMLRADMDGIAVDDAKDVPYASANAGVTHACGHDIHTTVMLGVAERLAQLDLPAGRVSIVFQPAEEMPFAAPSGAMMMLQDGLFAEDKPDAILALHCWPDLPAGAIGVDDVTAMGGKDAFKITLHGKPAHAATPSRGRDSILGIAQLVVALHQGFARSLDPGDLAILNVGTIAGGTSQSILAARAEVTGTVRSVDPVVRARLLDLVERTSAGVAAMLGLDSELIWSEAVPAIENDPGLARLARSVGDEVLGEANTYRLSEPPMTADDFAFFADLAPSLYLKLGVAGPDGCASLHNGAFDPDERSIGVGVAVMTELTLRLLAQPLGHTDGT